MATCQRDFSDVIARVQSQLDIGTLNSIELRVDEWNSTLLILINGYRIAEVAIMDSNQWFGDRDDRIRTEIAGLVAKLNAILPQPMVLNCLLGWIASEYRWFFGVERFTTLEAAEEQYRRCYEGHPFPSRSIPGKMVTMAVEKRSERYRGGTWPEDNDPEYPVFYLDWLRKYHPELVR